LRSKRPIQRFDDIIYNAEAIGRYTANMTQEQFFADDKTRDATLHCLMRIGEAASKLHPLADQLAPEQPWRSIRDLGNVLKHEYNLVDHARIWIIVSRELVPLRAACERAIQSIQSQVG
jgi:uncharacterized protein with HEPN domain